MEKSLAPRGWRSTESPIPSDRPNMLRITRERESGETVSSNTAEEPVIDAPTPKNRWYRRESSTTMSGWTESADVSGTGS